MLLWAGQTVSELGSRATALAFPLLVFELTASPARAGVVGFVMGLPIIVVQLPAGALVDRYDRKRIMVICDLGRLLIIASIPVVGALAGISYPQLVVTAFLHASFSVVFTLAERAALPHVVDAKSLPAAVAQNQARIQGATVAGQPMGGWLFSISRVLPFAVDALSFLISLMTLWAIRSSMYDPPTSKPRRLHQEIAEGMRFVWADRCLRLLTALSAVITLLTAGFSLVVIVLLGHLGAAPAQVGLVLGISGLGGLIGALVAPALVARVAAGWLNIGGLWIWALLVGLLVVAPSPMWGGVLVAGVSAVAPVLAVVAQTRRARMVPRGLLGRVYSVNLVISGGTAPLGALLAGVLLSAIGPVTTCLVMSVGLLAVAVIATASPTMRRADLPEAHAGQVPPP